MILSYSSKQSIESIRSASSKGRLHPHRGVHAHPNLLVKGDNLEVMRTLRDHHALGGKVDLVYIDPPFSTNTVFRVGDTRASTVSFSHDDEVAYSDELKGEEFIEFLRHRIVLLRELMSDAGSLYLHIDYKIGHYVKVMMDEIFGRKNFRNDISRIKCNPKNFSRRAFSNVKDMILFYTKTDDYVWNEPTQTMTESEIAKLFNKVDANGRRYTTNPLHAPGQTKNGKSGQEWRGMLPPRGRHWRYAPNVLDELDAQGLIEWSKNGVPRKIIFADDYGTKRVQDIWEFKDSQTVSYPTEKNLELLKLIVSTSSNEGQLVLDCFCGSGTTLQAAAVQGRHWIGVDDSDKAIKATRKRLSEHETSLFGDCFEYDLLNYTE